GQQRQQLQHGPLGELPGVREDAPKADQRYRDRASLHHHRPAGQRRPAQQAAHRLGCESRNHRAARGTKVSASRIPQTMETRSLILSPEQYTQVSPYELLCAAEQGFVGLDHRFLPGLVDGPKESIPDLVRFGIEEREGRRESLTPDLIDILRHLRAPKAIPFFLEDVRRNGLDATLPLIQALREIGEPA